MKRFITFAVFIAVMAFAPRGFPEDAAPVTDPAMPLYEIIGSDSITPLLSTDTLVWLRVPSLKDMTEEVEQLPLFQMLDSEPMRVFRHEMSGRIEDSLIDRFGLDLPSIRESIAGEFVVAGIGEVEEALSVTCFVQTASEEAAQALIDKTTALMIRRGATQQTATIDKSVRLKLIDPSEQLMMTPLGRHAMFSGDVEVAAKLMQRWRIADSQGMQKLDKRLIDEDRFRRSLTAISDPHISLLHWYFDPITMSVAGQEQLPSPDAELYKVDGQVAPFAMRHGLSRFQAVAGRAWVRPETGNLESRMVLYAPPPRESALAMFDFEPGKNSIPDFVGEEANNVTVLHWNLESMIRNAANIYDDATDAPGAFRGTMDDLKNELNVDLVDGLFTKIGPEVVLINIDDSRLNIESSIISVEIREPDQNELAVATMIYNLLIGDTEARRQRLPGRRYELWQIKLIVDEDTTPFTQAGVIVADGRLWLSTHASALRNYMLQRDRVPLNATPEHRSMQSLIAGEIDENTFGVSLSRMSLDVRATYEVLRTNGLDGLENVESIYATLVRSVFANEEEPAKESTIDFSLLPPFEEIREYLNNLTFVSRNSPLGWELFGVVFQEDKDEQSDE